MEAVRILGLKGESSHTRQWLCIFIFPYFTERQKVVEVKDLNYSVIVKSFVPKLVVWYLCLFDQELEGYFIRTYQSSKYQSWLTEQATRDLRTWRCFSSKVQGHLLAILNGRLNQKSFYSTFRANNGLYILRLFTQDHQFDLQVKGWNGLRQVHH